MGSRRVRPTDPEETPVEDEEIQEIREAVLALELLAEEALAEKGLLDRDIDSLSEEERKELSEPEVSALVWRGHVRLFPEWEAFREGGEFRGMSPRPRRRPLSGRGHAERSGVSLPGASCGVDGPRRIAPPGDP